MPEPSDLTNYVQPRYPLKPDYAFGFRLLLTKDEPTLREAIDVAEDFVAQEREFTAEMAIRRLAKKTTIRPDQCKLAFEGLMWWFETLVTMERAPTDEPTRLGRLLIDAVSVVGDTFDYEAGLARLILLATPRIRVARRHLVVQHQLENGVASLTQASIGVGMRLIQEPAEVEGQTRPPSLTPVVHLRLRYGRPPSESIAVFQLTEPQFRMLVGMFDSASKDIDTMLGCFPALNVART